MVCPEVSYAVFSCSTQQQLKINNVIFQRKKVFCLGNKSYNSPKIYLFLRCIFSYWPRVHSRQIYWEVSLESGRSDLSRSDRLRLWPLLPACTVLGCPDIALWCCFGLESVVIKKCCQTFMISKKGRFCHDKARIYTRNLVLQLENSRWRHISGSDCNFSCGRNLRK